MIGLLSANLSFNPNIVWSSIVQGINLLSKGIRWRAEERFDVKVWGDLWFIKILIFM